MNTLQLLSVLQRDKTFLDVYPCDLLPRNLITKRPTGIVVNTHPHTMPGEHWLALYLPAKGPGEFFDSYGVDPDNPRIPETITAFLWRQGKEIIFQKRQLQNPSAVTCGYHCVFFLQNRTKGLPFDQILKLYSEDATKNDRMVVEFVKNRKIQTAPRSCKPFHHIQACGPQCKT